MLLDFSSFQTKIMVRTKKKWCERDTVKFVLMYEAEPVLWNVKLKDYRNKIARNEAIQRIIDNFNISGLSVQDVNMKINNIRSTYLQEKAKVRRSTESGCSVDDVYTPSLVWFDIADSFLCNIIKSRRTNQYVVSTYFTSFSLS